MEKIRKNTFGNILWVLVVLAGMALTGYGLAAAMFGTGDRDAKLWLFGGPVIVITAIAMATGFLQGVWPKMVEAQRSERQEMVDQALRERARDEAALRNSRAKSSSSNE